MFEQLQSRCSVSQSYQANKGFALVACAAMRTANFYRHFCAASLYLNNLLSVTMTNWNLSKFIVQVLNFGQEVAIQSLFLR